MRIKEIPIVKVFRCEDGKHLTFWCPFCNTFHFHGSSALGPRGAHCARDGNSPYLKTGYWLKEYTKKELKELKLSICN